jgi:geranylgeranyl pyrophosphate synthase
MSNARSTILSNYKDDCCLSQALRYFSEVTLDNALPVFPALIGMSAEAVGGKSEDTLLFGEAMVFITAAADLHDDLIDNSEVKGKKQTVFGKFGSTTTILAGDILLIDGLKTLSKAGDNISNEQSTKITNLVSDAVFEISKAEVLESELRNKPAIKPQEYQEVIRLKSIVPELAMKIGAILGKGDSQVVEKLGDFGRAYGIISVNMEEFADLLEIDELRNRLRNECPPLPLMFARQNSKVRESLNPLLNNKLFNRSIHQQIIDIVLNSEEVDTLQKSLISTGKSAINELPYINGKIREELANSLLVPLAYFE